MAMKRFEILHEMMNLRAILLENRMDFLKAKYMKPLEAFFTKEKFNSQPYNVKQGVMNQQGDTLEELVFQYVASYDPDPTKKNTQWMLNMLLKGGMQLEDCERASQYLQQFAGVKTRLTPEQRDLNRYKTLGDLGAVLNQLKNSGTALTSKSAEERALEKKMYEEAKVVFNSPEYRILIPLTKAASCYFGVNTQWCTAARDSTNYFDSYNNRGPLYIILDKKNNKRWQFHFETSSYMDENDRPINVQNFLEAHPQVAHFFHSMSEKEDVVGNFNGNVIVRDDRGFVFKSGPGIFGKVRDRILIKDGKIAQNHLPVNLLKLNSRTKDYFPGVQPYADEVIDLFNGMGLPGRGMPEGVADSMATYGILFKGQWGSVEELGSDLMVFKDGWKWVGLKYPFNGSVYLALISNEGNNVCRALIDASTKEAYVSKPAYTGDQNALKAAANHVVDMVLKFKVKSMVQGDIYFSSSQFPDSVQERLLEKKAELCDYQTLMTSKEHIPLVKEKFEKIFADYLPKGGATWVQDRELAVKKYDAKNGLSDLISDFGGDEAEWFLSVVDGNEHIEFHDAYVDDDMRRDLLTSLSDEDRKKVGEYLKENYPDEVEDMEDYDPSSVSDIMDLFGETRDDDLDRAFYMAALSGNESGAASQAYDIFKTAVESSKMIYFKKGDEWTNEIQWDSPIIVTVDVHNLALAAKDRADDIENGDFDWADWLKEEGSDYKIDPQQGRYGFDEYDEDSAKERFAEQIHEFV